MIIFNLTQEEKSQLEKGLNQLEFKISKIETLIWYSEEEPEDVPVRTQDLINIIADYVAMLRKDIDEIYIMAGFKQNENAAPTDQDEELH